MSLTLSETRKSTGLEINVHSEICKYKKMYCISECIADPLRKILLVLTVAGWVLLPIVLMVMLFLLLCTETGIAYQAQIRRIVKRFVRFPIIL